MSVFQSTLPVGGATSTDASGTEKYFYFNPRSPWGERPRAERLAMPFFYFNPRSPWGERHQQKKQRSESTNFNPRSPWGERLPFGCQSHSWRNFNPRSPWGERHKAYVRANGTPKFQSTLPVGGATLTYRNEDLPRGISIHAPRGGSDPINIGNVFTYPNFNPRSPWGERLCSYSF